MVNRLSWKIRSKILAACAVSETINRICLLLFASSSARLSSSSNIQLHNPNKPAGERWIHNFRWKNTALNFGVGYPF